jgi:hypothetical protein
MEAFSPDQWLVLLLAFALGLFLGMALLANPRWKRRYREERHLRDQETKLRQEEVRKREALEAERKHWQARNIAEPPRADQPPPPV